MDLMSHSGKNTPTLVLLRKYRRLRCDMTRSREGVRSRVRSRLRPRSSSACGELSLLLPEARPDAFLGVSVRPRPLVLFTRMFPSSRIVSAVHACCASGLPRSSLIQLFLLSAPLEPHRVSTVLLITSYTHTHGRLPLSAQVIAAQTWVVRRPIILDVWLKLARAPVARGSRRAQGHMDTATRPKRRSMQQKRARLKLLSRLGPSTSMQRHGNGKVRGKRGENMTWEWGEAHRSIGPSNCLVSWS